MKQLFLKVGSGNHGNHAKGANHPRYKGRKAVRKTALYRLWLNLRSRCNNPNHPDYKYYGARGIAVCARWDSYELFAADVGSHPGPGWTLDRSDNNLGYSPGNTRWATRKTQARNRNYCKLDAQLAAQIKAAYVPGATRQVDLAAQFNVSQGTISHVILGRTWS